MSGFLTLCAGVGVGLTNFLLEYMQATGNDPEHRVGNTTQNIVNVPAPQPSRGRQISVIGSGEFPREAFVWPMDPDHTDALCLPHDVRFHVFCESADTERYKKYFVNAWEDLCAKLQARTSPGTPIDIKLAMQTVRSLRANTLTTHSLPAPLIHRFSFKEHDKEAELTMERYMTDIVAVVALDCLTKCSEHLMHAPKRIGYLFNTVVVRSYKCEGTSVTFTMPPMTELLRGHNQLATPDLTQEKQENLVNLYDLDLYSSLFYLHENVARASYTFFDRMFPRKRRLKVLTLFSVILLKLVYYMPLLQLKLAVLFVMLSQEYDYEPRHLLILSSAISLGLRILACIMRLWAIQSWMFRDLSPGTERIRCIRLCSIEQWSAWCRTNKMWLGAAFSWLAQATAEVLVIGFSLTQTADMRILFLVRVVTYVAANTGQLLSSALEAHQRPLSMALREGLVSVFCILIPMSALLYKLEDALFGMLSTIQDGSLCTNNYMRFGPLSYVDGCYLFQLFAILIFLADVYPVYIVVLSVFGLCAGLVRRYPFQGTLTPAGVRALGRKLFPSERDEHARVVKACAMLKKGMASLRERDLVGSTAYKELETALNNFLATPENYSRRESLPFDIRTLDTRELQHVFMHLLSHVQQNDLRTPARPSWDSLPSVTHLLPVYDETILFSYGDLMLDGDPQNQLKALVYNHQEEFLYFLERMHEKKIMKIASLADRKRFKQMCVDGNTSWTAGSVLNEEEFELELRLWASLRGQTVARTLLGLCEYSRVLVDLLEQERVQGEEHRRELASNKSQVLICHQLLAASLSGREYQRDLEAVLARICPEVDVEVCFDYDNSKPSHLSEQLQTLLPEAQYASGLMRWNRHTRKLDLVQVLPRTFPLRVGCDKENMTQGKAGNQRNGLLFARGDVIQAVDANQCWYYVETLLVPSALSLFSSNADRPFPRVRIVGFAERIFTIPLNPVAAAEGLAEFSFGTLVQRALSLCGVRLHYGHPDFLEASFVKYYGGMSLASAKINLSEDVFEGYKAILHGYKSEHVEFLMMGKARETNLLGATKFNSKIAMGAGCGVCRSPEAIDMVMKVDAWRATISYLATLGWYDFQLLSLWSTYVLVVTFIVVVLQKQEQRLIDATSSSQAVAAAFVQLAFGMLPVVIGVFELVLRFGIGGLGEALKTMLIGFSEYVFQSITRQSAYARAILKRKAVYVATGRSLGFEKQNVVSLVSTYASTHIYPCLSILEYLVVFQGLAAIRGYDTGSLPFLPLTYVVVTFVLVAPSLYNPDQTVDTIKQDYLNTLPRYLMVRHTSTTEKDWVDDGFDKQVTKMGQDSFTNTFFTDFLFCQDSWENHLILWTLIGICKLLFFVVLMSVSAVDRAMLKILIYMWCVYAAYIFTSRSHHLQLSVYFKYDLEGIGMLLAAGSLGLCIYTGIFARSISVFDVLASAWMLAVLLRQALTVCLQFTSVFHYRRALHFARTDGQKAGLYQVLRLQEAIYWRLYRVFLCDSSRRVAVIFVWAFGVIGAVLSAILWRFYLRSALVRYVDRQRSDDRAPRSQRTVLSELDSVTSFESLRFSPDSIRVKKFHSISTFSNHGRLLSAPLLVQEVRPQPDFA